MSAGRPQKADPGSLYAFAHQFYWDFRRLSEGTRRWLYDREKYEALEKQILGAEIELDDGQKLRAREVANEESERGNLREENRENRIRDIEDAQRSATREMLRLDAVDESRQEKGVPGEKEVIEQLLNSNVTPEQIRALCKTAVMQRRIQVEPGVFKDIDGFPAWPIPVGSVFPTYLSQYAEQYVAALHDPRFPRCDTTERPTTRLKQFWFLSRALAGALFGVSTRTAINLVGSLRPEESFRESREAKPQRIRRTIRKRK